MFIEFEASHVLRDAGGSYRIRLYHEKDRPQAVPARTVEDFVFSTPDHFR